MTENCLVYVIKTELSKNWRSNLDNRKSSIAFSLYFQTDSIENHPRSSSNHSPGITDPLILM